MAKLVIAWTWKLHIMHVVGKLRITEMLPKLL